MKAKMAWFAPLLQLPPKFPEYINDAVKTGLAAGNPNVAMSFKQ